MKKIGALLSATFCLLMFTACGKNSDHQPATAETPAETQSRIVISAAKQGVFLTFADGGLYSNSDIDLGGVGATDGEIAAAIESVKEYYLAIRPTGAVEPLRREVSARNAIAALQSRRTAIYTAKLCEAQKK